MASEVDICNLALSRLGDSATISSINPPDQSAQAGYCKTFYPISRDIVLESHHWTFATRRSLPAQIASWAYSQWQYAYAAPAGMLNVIAVLDSNATDDFSQPLVIENQIQGSTNIGLGNYSPQPFSLESLDDGSDLILTNQNNALLRYTVGVTDTTKFSAMFVDALGWHLASSIAGPLLKGDAGAAAAKSCYQAFLLALGKAEVSDANNQRRNINQSVSWMVNR